MQHDICYVSCNCNQTPTAVHWGKNGLICYASCNSVRIYNPKFGSGGKVLATLVGHSKRVNSVRWLGGVDYETELVSGSTDHTAIVWYLKNNNYVPFVLEGHASNVNLVDGLHTAGKTLVVTVSMDSSAKIWNRQPNTEGFLLNQTIDFGYSICVGVRIAFLPPSNVIILACAMDNSNIELYTEDDFAHAATLKGHEDWVRGLDFTIDGKNDLILASSSQDCYIRLWRISSRSDRANADNIVKTSVGTYHVVIDSILTGHEGWVYSVNWNAGKLQLLSSSLDKSMIIWELEKDSCLWVEKVRVGGVGGNTLGFYGGVWGPHGDVILGHGYHGAFHIWQLCKERWQPAVTVGGHFAEVTDMTWEPQGQFLVSVSNDQTTRIHASWTANNKLNTWHEIARPQVHGFDLTAIVVLSRYKFASSAEEKVIRTFQAPLNFIDNFRRICSVKDEVKDGDCCPEGASVPSLGLSNKAVFLNEEQQGDDAHFTPTILDVPPTEETLLQNTLWPETQKLYGHGYEVYSLASSPDGHYLASSCKATTPEHAAILLWETTTWRLVQNLLSHSLTVVELAFSPNSQHLLSVSRDRRWSLFSKIDDHFKLVATVDKKTSIHARIIWCCAWSHDSNYFATGSRDAKVVVWTKNKSEEKGNFLRKYLPASQHLDLKNDSVTALAFAPVFVLGDYLVVAGFECGVIQGFRWSVAGWKTFLNLDQRVAHHLTVTRLKFRPVVGPASEGNDAKNKLQLASCSNDNSVIIHDLIV